jgi:hypothetical protein
VNSKEWRISWPIYFTVCKDFSNGFLDGKHSSNLFQLKKTFREKNSNSGEIDPYVFGPKRKQFLYSCHTIYHLV